MSEFLMSPKVDFCFKELMQDSIVRQGFISAILKVDPKEVTETVILPTILEKHHIDDKLSILDVRVELADKRQINMEMQVYYYSEWVSRSLYYLSRMYVEQLKEGYSYNKLKKCIHVGILDFELFEDIPSFYSKFHIRADKWDVKYTDDFEFHVLELPKLGKYDNPKEELLKWAKFFNSKKEEEFNMAASNNMYIERAYENLQVMSMDEQKRLEYEARQKAIRDHIYFTEELPKRARDEGYSEGFNNGREKGFNDGFSDGRQQGFSDGEYSVIERALRMGNTPKTVSEFIGTPLERVLEVQKSMLDEAK